MQTTITCFMEIVDKLVSTPVVAQYSHPKSLSLWKAEKRTLEKCFDANLAISPIFCNLSCGCIYKHLTIINLKDTGRTRYGKYANQFNSDCRCSFVQGYSIWRGDLDNRIYTYTHDLAGIDVNQVNLQRELSSEDIQPYIQPEYHMRPSTFTFTVKS